MDANKITSNIIKITPDLARMFLAKNSVNRSIRNSNIKFFCNEIKTGSFKTTHQGIAIANDGTLLDGQHRLLAIIETNIPVEMLVTKNLDKSTFHAMDCGSSRSMADRTGFDQKVAECTRYLIRLGFNNNQAISKSAEMNINLAKAGVLDLHDELLSYARSNRRIFGSAQVRSAAIIMVLNGHEKDYVFNIYKNLVNQEFINLPPIALSFVKHVNNNSLNIGFGTYYFARAIKVFNKELSDVSKLICNDSDVLYAETLAKTTVKKLLAD